METVYILTVIDMADFDRVKFEAAYRTIRRAEENGEAMVRALVAEDTSGLGDTFCATVQEYIIRD